MSGTSSGKLNILELEKSLGIWWPRGLSRQKDARKIPIIGKLLHEIDRITQTYGGLAQREIRRSADLRQAASVTFMALGSELWPDSELDRSPWLVSDAANDDLGGLYPKNLYFSDLNDREKLHNLFLELIVAKCVRYYENHGRHWHYEFDPNGTDASMLVLEPDAEAADKKSLACVDKAPEGSPPSTPINEATSIQPDPSKIDEQVEGASPNICFRPLNASTTSIQPDPSKIDEQVEGASPNICFRPLNASTTSNLPAETPQAQVKSLSNMSTRTRSPESDRFAKKRKVPDQRSSVDARKLLTPSLDSHQSSMEDVSQDKNDSNSSSDAHEILGDLVNCPAVIKILQGRHTDGLSREHWTMLRSVLISRPAAREDSTLLHAELSRLDKDSTTKGLTVSSPPALQPQTDSSDQLSATALESARDRRVSRGSPRAHMAPMSIPPIYSPAYKMGGTRGTPQLPHPQIHQTHQLHNIRSSWPTLVNNVRPFPRMNIWLRLKGTMGRSAIIAEKQMTVFDMFQAAQQKMARKLDGRPIASLTFTHVGRSIEDDPIEVEPQDQVTWEALMGLVLSFQGPDPIELRAVVDS